VDYLKLGVDLWAALTKLGQPSGQQELTDRVARAQPQVDTPLRARLLHHLDNALQRLERALAGG
jgi:hypothetical protein